jgi:rhodanese-related sulfurtransferase
MGIITMSNTTSPDELKAMLADGQELALMDVREEGVHSASHLLYASPMPLSRLEVLVEDLIPRKSVRIVLVDDGAGSDLSARAAKKMADDYGYNDISILDGGMAAWEEAGYVLFSGVHVPSKAFGEYVEINYDTPRMDAAIVKAKLDAGEDVIILDSRPMDEFNVMNIPTGIDCPGAELVYRISDLVPSPDTEVIVNCAGRTRSIIGAQSLINAGIPNKVSALKNGTMGWHLSGLQLEHGNHRTAPDVSAAGLAQAKSFADNARKRFGVQDIDKAGLEAWQAEQEETSLYILDVRTQAEYEAGHIPGSLHAPGGQLVQGTERWLATLGARAVLVDEDGVRSTMTASWLIQMGWKNVRVLSGGLSGFDLESGARPSMLPSIVEDAFDFITAEDLAREMDKGEVVVVDFADSRAYKDGHIPGAWFAIRARLPESLPKLTEKARMLVFTGPDATIPTLAAPEASELTDIPIKVLAGGTAAWTESGRSLHDGLEFMADNRDDIWMKPYDHDKSIEDRMRDYLTWEVDLVNEIERDGDHRFVLFE